MHRSVDATQAIDSVPASTCSYDVFDTTITRSLYCPEDLFFAVGEALHRAGLCQSGKSWANLRKLIERRVRLNNLTEEITLDEIYSALAGCCRWSPEQRRFAQHTELGFEQLLSTRIAAIQNEILTKRQQGWRCIFLSDTYLSSANILVLLQSSGLVVDRPDVFCSSEVRMTKGYGGLYRHVSEAIQPEKISEHSGDNYKSDVIRANEHGIKAHHIKIALPTRYEQALYRSGKADRLIRSAVAGASRSARLAEHFGDQHHNTIWTVGANVMGPFLTAFVCWVLLDAKQRGISKLHFIARDGWIMKEIAERLRPWLRHEIECHYLYGSRQAWHAASLSDVSDQTPSWLVENLSFVSLDGFLSRLGLQWDICDSICREFGFTDDDRAKPLGVKGTGSAQKLVCDSRFQAIVRTHASALRERAISYLRQEGVASSEPIALVDIGWEGRMQASLCSILQEAGAGTQKTILGYYLGLSANMRDWQHGIYSSFLHELDAMSASLALHQNRTMAEIMCTAPHGTTLGYEMRDGRIQPQLAPSPMSMHELNIQRKAILTFATQLSANAIVLDFDIEVMADYLKKAATSAWTLFLKRPTLDEATTYGRFVHGHEQGDNSANAHSTAPRLRGREFLRALLVPPKHMGKLTWWIEGSAKRSFTGPFLVCALLLCECRSWAIYALRSILAKRRRFLSEPDLSSRHS